MSALRRVATRFGLIGMFALCSPSSDAAPSFARNWAAALRIDAKAVHDLIEANHPGPVNDLDPNFRRRSDASFATALRRAARVSDYSGYFWAMRAYIASFDDGHVQLDVDKPLPLPLRWPGFLTGFDDAGRQIVRTRADDAPVTIGAELLACDGVPAAELVATHVGAFVGRWQLASQRVANGGRLFLDAGNPFITRPSRCRFQIDGQSRDVELTWRTLAEVESRSRLDSTVVRADPPIEARILSNGARWFSMSDFNGYPESSTAKSLRSMIADMERDRAAILAAPAVILDLRGNGGGSSDWSVQIARVIWGASAVEAEDSDAEFVEWRASPANIAKLESYRQEFQSDDSSQELRDWASNAVNGMTAAYKNGQRLWREPNEPSAAVERISMVAPFRGRVYVLTDLGCASACLDAVDLWRALGAVQIGQETSADTFYMDLRADRLPSKVAVVAIPMKVYRGRKRGSNEPWIPVYRYMGDMRDTNAIEKWIAALQAQERTTRLNSQLH